MTNIRHTFRSQPRYCCDRVADLSVKYGTMYASMTIGNFVKKRKYLFWSTKNYDNLSPEVVVEGVLNYGNWDDVQELIKILGMEKVATIFRLKSIPDKYGRQNYRPEIKYYFNLYFNKYANV